MILERVTYSAKNRKTIIDRLFECDIKKYQFVDSDKVVDKGNEEISLLPSFLLSSEFDAKNMGKILCSNEQKAVCFRETVNGSKEETYVYCKSIEDYDNLKSYIMNNDKYANLTENVKEIISDNLKEINEIKK